MEDRVSATKDGIIGLRPTKGTHWVLYINEKDFDFYGCLHWNYYQILSLKGKRKSVFPEHKTPRTDIYCVAYCYLSV